MNEAELFEPYKALDWDDIKAVRTAVWNLKKALGVSVGQTYEWLAQMNGFPTYASMRADLKLRGMLTGRP